MSDEVTKLKRKIKMIEPLKQKNEIELNVVRQELKEQLVEYDKSVDVHNDLLGQQQVIVKQVHEAYGNDKDLSIHDMTNIRHYLHKLDDDVKQAMDELSNNSKKLDLIKDVVTVHQVNRKLYDKQQAASKKGLGHELNKLHMNEMDDMWARKTITEQ